MKYFFKFAALLAVLFLALCLAATAENEAFQISQDTVLPGMGRSWRQGYAPAVSGNTLSLLLPIRSDRAQGPIQAEILLDSGNIPLFKTDAVRTVRANRNENGEWNVRFSLELLPDRANGDYPCRIRVTGTDGDGRALRTDIPLTLRIRSGQPSREELRVSVENLQADFRVGEDGMITALLVNPCQAAIFENLRVSFSDPSGDILPRFEAVLRAGSLGPGERREVSLPVTVLPKAAVTPHVIQISISFTALDSAVAQEETYTLAVTQEMRLEHGGLRMADSAVAGDSVTLSLPLMNMGRADVMNVLCTLNLPGIAERQAVLVGTIGPGETKQAQMTVTVPRTARGEFAGSLTVEAQDGSGNPVSLSLPVGLTAEAPAVSAALDSSVEQETEKPPLLLYGLGGGCGLLFLVLMLQGLLLRRKIHRLEEDRL